MSLAVAGHGATIAVEKSPVVPGTFTTVAELNGDINWPALTRAFTITTPHQDTIGSGVTGVINTGALTFSTNYIFNDATHDHLTGLYKLMIDNTRFGVRLRGPSGSAGVDEWIMSGQITNIERTDPVREGARSANITFQPSKAIIIDGVTVGQAA